MRRGWRKAQARRDAVPVDVDAYLARIGASRADDLAALQAAHLRTVPFEDYDIHLGIPLSMDADDVFDKIVRRHRGGFCYELNGLFGELLRALGYEVEYLSAYETLEDGSDGPEFDHLRLLVGTEDGSVVVDVGQGRRWTRPVPLRVGEHDDVRVERVGEVWTTYQRTKQEWQRDWSFTATPRTMGEFAERCHHLQQDPGSHFRRNRLAWLAVPAGRLALSNGVLRETGTPVRHLTLSEEMEVLQARFGIELPPGSSW